MPDSFCYDYKGRVKTQDVVCEYMFWLKMLCFFGRIEKDFPVWKFEFRRKGG